MNTKNIVSLVGLILATVAIAAPAQANDHWWQGFYIGAGAGAGRFESDLQKLDLMPVPTTTPALNNMLEQEGFNDTGIASKYFFGYRILKHLAVEGGGFKFHDLEDSLCFLSDVSGECSGRPGSIPGTPPDPPLPAERVWTVEVPLKGITAYLVGIKPFNDTVELVGKAGVVYWKSDPSARENIVGGFIPCDLTAMDQCGPGGASPDPTNPPQSRKYDGTDLALGIGVNFNTESGISVRTEAEWFDIGIADQTWMLSLSVIYNFGGNLVK
jgi:opacity protein-like surface antigen